MFLVPTEPGMKQHGTKNFRYLLDWKPYDGTKKQLNIELNFEQVPHRKSRILLDRNSAPDALGQPRIKLDWQFTEQDQKTVNGSLQMIKSLLQDEDKFNIKFSDWMQTEWPDFYKNVYPPAEDVTNTQLYTGDHHLGTCAMRAGGYAGVVDSDCRFVGGSNLWACSTGVFTTGGWANSTLTLMALALRLADKLKKEPWFGADVSC
jgi:choline dehydrogenase-like flavoprotein